MGKFILKRLGQLLLSLFIASVLVFVFVRLSNTDPVAVILGGKQTSQETIQAIREKFNLDKPLFQQYFLWIDGLFHGDLGLSFKYQTSINDLIGPRLLTTLGLVTAGSLIALVIAIPLGIFCAVKKHTLWDRAGSIFSLVLAGCPSFFVSILLILLISAVAPSYPFTGSYSTFGEYCQRLFVPSLALACTMIALASRVMRSSMIEQINSPYTMTAKAKGVPQTSILFKHNLRNAVIPVIAVVSIQIGSMVVGAVLVENVFSLSGLGTFLVDSITSSDYAVVQDITIMLVCLFLLISTAADIIYAAIDPRIRLK